MDKAVKGSCRRDKLDWFERKRWEAQHAADQNNTRELFKIAEQLSGKSSNTNFPVKNRMAAS